MAFTLKPENSCVCTKPVTGMASAHIQKQRFRRDFRVGAKPHHSHLESGTSLNIGEVRRQSLSADLHRSKPFISLVPFNLHFHCFQGIGALLCDNPYCFSSWSKTIFQIGARLPVFVPIPQAIYHECVFLTWEIEKLRTSLKYDGKQVRKV